MADCVPLSRLPFEIREELCFRLRDRMPAPKLLAWLLARGFGPYTPQSLSKFRHSKQGYQAWLAEQRKLDERRERSESIRREIAAAGFSMLDKTMLDLADELSDPALPAVKAASALAALKNAVTAEKKLELDRRKTEVAERNAELEREKFRFSVAKEALAILQDRKAKEIAESDAPASDKIAAILARMDELEADG
jgi:hypothetical protein